MLFPKKIDAFIDNFRYGKTEPDTGLPILSLDEYLISSDHAKDHTKFIISVVDSKIEHTIRRQLQQAGIENSAVIGLNGAYRNNTSQYFDVLVPGEHESFVDCGCYDGSTSLPVGVEKMDMKRSGVLSRIMDPMSPVKRT